MGASIPKGNPCSVGYGREAALTKDKTGDDAPIVFDSGFLVAHSADSANLYPKLCSNWFQTRLCVKQKLFSWTDNFKVKLNDGKDVLEVQSALLTMRGRVAIRNMAGDLVAMLLQKVLTIKWAYYIYAPIPRVGDQEPSSETGPEGQTLYSWALVSMMPFECTVRPSLRMQMATGNDTFGDADYVGRKPAMCTYKMDITKNLKGCCRIDRAFFQFDCANCYQLTISAGIDPVLMVCYTIIKDELDEGGGGRECGENH